MKSYPMMAESVDIIFRLLESTEPIDYEGRFWKFRGMRRQLRSYQQPRMPLAIASSGNPVSVEFAGKYGMLLLSPAGKNRKSAEQWHRVEAVAAEHGGRISRDNWRLATVVYLAESREEAWADVEEGIRRDMEYFFAIGLKASYESYPGQPAHEITRHSGADRRDWIIGTPDDVIAQIERLQSEAGGFGGLMLTTHAVKSCVNRSISSRATSCPIFAATRGYQDEWQRPRQAAAQGGVKLDREGRASNLVRSEDLSQAPINDAASGGHPVTQGQSVALFHLAIMSDAHWLA